MGYALSKIHTQDSSVGTNACASNCVAIAYLISSVNELNCVMKLPRSAIAVKLVAT
jgi:hypothetical protein